MEKFKRLTIITNDLRILSILGANKNFNVILTGGFYNPEEYTLYGKQCEEVLSHFNIDIAFITVNALSLEHGLTDFRIHEVGVIQTILSRTKYKVVVADSSKFETSSYIKICPLKNIDLIVTDSSLPSILQRNIIGIIFEPFLHIDLQVDWNINKAPAHNLFFSFFTV